MIEKNTALAIDQNARNKFENELKGYAGIYALSEMFFTAKTLNTHMMEFRNGLRGPKDHHRARAFKSADMLPKGEKAVLAALLSIDAKGFEGIAAPGEVVGAMVERTTGGYCKERTYRRHKNALVRRGWLSQTRVSTGTRVLDDNGKWKSRTIWKVFLTPVARLLMAKSTTSDHISLPRPKWPSTEGDNTSRGDVSTFPPTSISDETTYSKSRARDKGASEVSPKGDGSTRPQSTTSPATSEQRTLRSAPRKAAKSPAPVLPAPTRKSRAKIPKTYSAARRDLLRTLFDAYHGDEQFDALYFAAKEQTRIHYPSVFKTALDWEKHLFRWQDLKWNEKRRALKNEIMPRLRAHVALFTPPDKRVLDTPGLSARRRAELENELAQYEENAKWAQVLPDALPGRIPSDVRDKLEKNRVSLNYMAVMIQRGKTSCADLSDSQLELLSLCEIFFGC